MLFHIPLKRTAICLMVLPFLLQNCSKAVKEIERPEKVVSKRLVIYATATYEHLAKLWKEYYQAFPSEEAYANWMYAARYAEDPEYAALLQKGVKKYPANPTLLYLKGIEKLGRHDSLEGQQFLEKATRLDPTYMDPWFGLVSHYMGREPEKLRLALQRLLEGNAISDVVMDYNYNVLTVLDQNALLLTNGDMDTYPIWILQQILGYRTDVTVVNRSLLNTDWYPLMLMKEKAPRFITSEALTELRGKIIADLETQKSPIPPGGLLGDTLIVRLIETATREGRSVYFAATLFSSPLVDSCREKGRSLGLVSLVTPLARPIGTEIENLTVSWLNDFRVAGLDNWSFRHSDKKVFSRRLALNYAYGLMQLLEETKIHPAETRLELFHWYRDHVLEWIPTREAEEMGQRWCSSADIAEIRGWCQERGYLK